MTDAREIIAKALHERDILTLDACRRYAGYVLSDLTAASFRILGPDEVDQVTLEKAAAWCEEYANDIGNSSPAADAKSGVLYKAAQAFRRSIGRKA